MVRPENQLVMRAVYPWPATAGAISTMPPTRSADMAAFPMIRCQTASVTIVPNIAEVPLTLFYARVPRGAPDTAVIIDGLIVIGSAIADDNRTDADSDEVCAYDARTGDKVWSWDPIPQHAADPAAATWRGSRGAPGAAER